MILQAVPLLVRCCRREVALTFTSPRISAFGQGHVHLDRTPSQKAQIIAETYGTHMLVDSMQESNENNSITSNESPMVSGTKVER